MGLKTRDRGRTRDYRGDEMRKIRMKQGARLAAAVACATLVLAGCGDDGGGSIEDQTEENESAAAEAGRASCRERV